MIECGGLVAKARLDHIDRAALFGALLLVRQTLDADPQITVKWKAIGLPQMSK